MKRWSRWIAVTVGWMLASIMVPASASADAPTWFLKNANSGGIADTWFKYGNPGDIPLAGDWNGDGVDTPAVARRNAAGWMDWHLRNVNSDGVGQISFAWGNNTDRTLVGDWNRDGVDTPAVTRPNAAGWMDWWLKNANDGTWRTGDRAVRYGNGSGDVSVVGDWNGDGIATPGLYRRSNGTFYLADDFSGQAVASFRFGTSGNTDDVLVGDWNGDGYTSIGLFRRSTYTWTLSNYNGTGAPAFSFNYGNPGDLPVVGDWDGNGTDTAGVVRQSVAYPTSVVYGGGNASVDTTAEIEALDAALEAAADSDEAYDAIMNGLSPADVARYESWIDAGDDGAEAEADMDVDDPDPDLDTPDWGALPGDLGERVSNGELSFAQARAAIGPEQKPVNCNASIRHHVGGVQIIHSEGPDIPMRKITWTVRHTCTGVSAIAFHGNPDLHRANGKYLLVYGEAYDDVLLGAGPSARVRLVRRNSWLQPGVRRPKRVVWHTRLEVPTPYYWINDEPFIRQRGIDKPRSSCTRSVPPDTYPFYLGVLKCKLVSYKFR